MKRSKIARELREVLRIASMETTNFSQLHGPHDFPTSEKEVTLFIKERTRLWRQTWIIPQLKKAIKEIER